MVDRDASLPTPENRWLSFLLITAVAHVILTLWVRRDARQRDVDPSPWVSLTLLTGVGGVVGYRRCHGRQD